MPEVLAYRDRPVVGIIELSTSIAMTVEAGMAFGDAATPVIGRLELPRGEADARALDEMLGGDALEVASEQLAVAGATAIAFACTTGSLLHGPGFDVTLCRRITGHTGLPATTTATALLASLRELGATTVGVGTPYVDELNDREREFLEAAGHAVVAIRGLGIARDVDIARVGHEDLVTLADGVAVDDAEAVFLSCTNLPTLPALAGLEARLGRPVLSSNAVTIRALARLAGVTVAPRIPVGSHLAAAL